MAEFRRLYYGWHDVPRNVFRVSPDPPDAPVRRSVEWETVGEARAFAERKRAKLLWWPKLPDSVLTPHS